MMASSSRTVSNHSDANFNRSRESKRKKRRKDVKIDEPLTSLDRTSWSTPTEQQIYSSKLLQALRHVRRNNENSSPVVAGRAVRETADRVLAVTAKGRSRWSREILTGRLSLRLSQINKKHKKAKVNSTGNTMKPRKPAAKKRLPPLQRKVRVLGRLVPGCQKLPFPNLLEEATDYIAALKMQIRAMTVLTGLLTPGGAAQPDQLG